MIAMHYSSKDRKSHPQIDRNSNYYNNNPSTPLLYNNNNNNNNGGGWASSASYPQMEAYSSVTPNNHFITPDYNKMNNNKSSSMDLRPRYPQQFQFQHPSTYSANGSYNFNTSDASNCGRSNSYSPTYMGLTEVLASRAPGTTILSLESKKRYTKSIFKNIKLKYIFLICLALILISIFGIILFNLYRGNSYKGKLEPANIKNSRTSKVNEANLNENPSISVKKKNLPKEPVVIQQQQRKGEGEHRPINDKSGKNFKVEYSVDADDDEVAIEDFEV